MASDYDPRRTGSWLVCTACGTQFPTAEPRDVPTCFICDDPRQFTPPTGQAFTTLDRLRDEGHRNVWTPVPGQQQPESSGDQLPTFTSIATEPRVAIGQRAILIRTPRGNILWDCITLLDDETVRRVRAAGGLAAIVISHPHYYSTHLEWARAFGCPVYLAAEDEKWLVQRDGDSQVFIAEGQTELDVPVGGSPSGAKALKLGGHFPGSLVLLYESRLLVADTFVTTPAGRGSWEADALGRLRSRPSGMNSFSFLWSIPNMIPLPPDELARMWRIIVGYEYHSSHGAFVGLDIVGKTPAEMRRRVLESMQIQVKHMGMPEHPLLQETAD